MSSDRTWIIQCLAVVALRIDLSPGESLVVTRAGRLVVVSTKPMLGSLCVLRSADDAYRPSFEMLEALMDAHLWDTLE